MNPILALLIIVVVIVGFRLYENSHKNRPGSKPRQQSKEPLVISAERGFKQEGNNYPYVQVDKLFTPAEQIFLEDLSSLLKNQFNIYGKVRVADVLWIEKGISRSEWQTAFNKINRKHFDYVLCDKEDNSFVCAVELNDSSHNSGKRKERDDFLMAACSAANFPLVMVPWQRSYSWDYLKQCFFEIIPEDIFSEIPPKPIEEKVQPVSVEPIKEERKNNCPKCLSELKVRNVTKGEHTGKNFLVCLQCKHVAAIVGQLSEIQS